MKYWENPKIDDPLQHEQQVQAICEAYAQAISAYAHGTHTISTDEKTGIQALERLHPDKRMRSGKVALLEFEYRRHGTLCLIPSFEVATGRITQATVGPTRTEKDFANHIRATLAQAPDATWIFIADQLNTHKSASLVTCVAELCGIKDALGEKGKSGILENMASRAAFLQMP